MDKYSNRLQNLRVGIVLTIILSAASVLARLLIPLGVDNQGTAEDAVWFDDVELYRLPNTT